MTSTITIPSLFVAVMPVGCLLVMPLHKYMHALMYNKPIKPATTSPTSPYFHEFQLYSNVCIWVLLFISTMWFSSLRCVASCWSLEEWSYTSLKPTSLMESSVAHADEMCEWFLQCCWQIMLRYKHFIAVMDVTRGNNDHTMAGAKLCWP